MLRKLLGVALVTLNALACSSAPIDKTDDGTAETQVGSVNLPLTTSSADGTAYRLNQAVFTITGPALGGKPRVVKPPADEPVHHEVLPIGSYSIELEKGWVLEKKGADSKTFTAVSAALVTDNPLRIDVTSSGPADAFFGFATVSGDVTLGDGSANIRIGVEDCSSYDVYMAALGELTVDCLGTIDPRAYEITKDGVMRATFDECTVDSSRMLPIKQLLSLQTRKARLPFVKQCMVDRFAVAQQRFLNSGVKVCPTWKDKGIINPISTRTIAAMLKETPLPDLDVSGSDDVRPSERVFEILKQQAFYTLSLDNAPSQQCDGPGRCAEVCAAAFPGFIVSTDGNRAITDPVAWLTDTMYPAKPNDPYLSASYYHPMSFYGPLPGAVFGSYSRFQACDPADPVNCPPEACSYWAGTHLKRRLQKDCIDPTDLSTCVSYCGPTLP